MFAAATTRKQQTSMAQETGISENVLLELVQLSDLARLPGVKGIRARLYFDAGVDSVEKLIGWQPEALRMMIADYADCYLLLWQSNSPWRTRNFQIDHHSLYTLHR